MMSLMEAAIATGGLGGRALHGNPHIEGVSTDSRTIASGELFVALKGEQFDGHEYLAAAVERGAVAAMVSEDWLAGEQGGDAQRKKLPLLVVSDTRRALGELGAAWRNRFEIALIGITGSNGKTTVKEMTAAILRVQARLDGLDPALAVLATQGNLNNDIGLPQMLLRLHASHRAAVIEMGMNHPGEIAYLSRLAQPTVALVNNAQRAHLAGLGGLADVARAKGEIFSGLREDGTALINVDDPFAGVWRELSGTHRVIGFGLAEGAQVRGEVQAKGLASVIRLTTPQGAGEVTLAVPGLHNARNALAAAAAALAAGASLDAVLQGLTSFGGVKGRLQIRATASGAQLIDDSYNANPDSVRAAIDVLAATPGRKILVLGDMGEIGGQAGQFHDEIGGYAKSEGVDQLFGLGEHSAQAVRNFAEGGRHFASVETLLVALRPQLDAQTTVLVKGSRFMRMERIADALAGNAPAAPADQDRKGKTGHVA